MELAQDKIDLISRIIKNDRKYPNNEDLYDDFFNETCKRSVAILDAIDTESTLETYLRRVVTTSIINVLKDSGRLRRTRSGYMSTNEVTLDDSPSVDYSDVVISYSDVKIPENPPKRLRTAPAPQQRPPAAAPECGRPAPSVQSSSSGSSVSAAKGLPTGSARCRASSVKRRDGPRRMAKLAFSRVSVAFRKAKSPQADIMAEPPLETKGKVTPVSGRMSTDPNTFRQV